jgi:hypothetical protein
MNLGAGELLAVLLNVVLLAAIPAIVVLFIVLAVRRLRDLESRITTLERMIVKVKASGRDA